MTVSNSPDICRPPQAVPIPACQPRRHLVCFSVYFCLLFAVSLAFSLAHWSRGRVCARWKVNKMPLDPAALGYSSVKQHYPDNPTKKKHQPWGFKAKYPDIYCTEYGKADWTGKAAGQTQHPCQGHVLFCILSWLFFFLHISCSQQYKLLNNSSS